MKFPVQLYTYPNGGTRKACDQIKEVGGLLSAQDAASGVPAYRLEGLSFEEYVGMRGYSRTRELKKKH